GPIGLTKSNGRWTAVSTRQPRFHPDPPEKTPFLQGPIDDVFTQQFLCVRGTGTAWHPAVARYAEAELDRFARTWDKYLRGKVPIKNDTDVDDADIKLTNLVLFGDPSSNSLIAKVLPKLPLTWTKDRVAL